MILKRKCQIISYFQTIKLLVSTPPHNSQLNSCSSHILYYDRYIEFQSASQAHDNIDIGAILTVKILATNSDSGK